MALNPAALGALEGWSLTYSHVAAARDTSFRDRYDGAWFAAPLGRAFALGGGIDFMRARDGSGAHANGAMLATALGSPTFNLGTSWRMRSPRVDRPNIHTADVALAFRPSPTLALSVIGRDLAVGDRLLGTRKVRESGLLAVALRPLGDDRLGLELAGRVDAAKNLGLRVAAMGWLPYVGRLGAAGELTEVDGRQQWTLTAGIDVRFEGLSLAPAVHLGEHGDDVGWSLLADVHGAPRVGVPSPRVVWKVPLRGLGSRRVLGVARTLERALHDPRVEGVVLVPQGANMGLATAQELRMAIAALEAADKPVYCYLQSASGAEFYACAGARRIAIDPAGSVRLMGIGGASFYFGELLRNVGLRADFVRIGTYKSAPEQYTNDVSSAPTREVRTALMDGAYRRLTSDLSVDLGLSESGVKQLIDRGPFLAEEAMREKLTSATVDPHDVDRDGRSVFGPRAKVRAPSDPAREPTFGPTGQVGVVVVDGTIVDGENVDVPLFDVHMSGGRTIAEALDKLADDSRIRAIVLRIDSPGGAVMASDQIWRAVRRARAKKPVIASLGEVAASGGYYAAAAADEIWALPSSITGSIGIFYGKVDVAQLAARIGVGIEHESRGAHAAADSLFRPFTEDERAALADKLRIWYRQFLERVAEGRKMPIENVDALARGRVYSGDEAHDNGLIDHLGGFASALARARELGRVPVGAELVVVPRVPTTLVDYVLGSGAKSAASTAAEALPPALKALAQRVYPWARIDAATPMALYEGPLGLE
ncbi:MAG: signal peptide peptidase SppA [Polyangiales bacterium]